MLAAPTLLAVDPPPFPRLFVGERLLSLEIARLKRLIVPRLLGRSNASSLSPKSASTPDASAAVVLEESESTESASLDLLVTSVGTDGCERS